MPRKLRLKVFGTMLMLPWAETRQTRAVVAVTSQRAAAEAFGITMYEAKNFMGTTGNDREVRDAMAEPGVVIYYGKMVPSRIYPPERKEKIE